MSVHMGNPAAKKKLSGEPELDQDWKDVCSDILLNNSWKNFKPGNFPRETLEAARQRAKK